LVQFDFLLQDLTRLAGLLAASLGSARRLPRLSEMVDLLLIKKDLTLVGVVLLCYLGMLLLQGQLPSVHLLFRALRRLQVLLLILPKTKCLDMRRLLASIAHLVL